MTVDPSLNLDQLQEKIGYRFSDIALLCRAVTHRSWSEEAVGQQSSHQHHNERLEFLGDTVLGLAVTNLLCRSFEAAPEGVLSQVRAKMVGTDGLAEVAARLDLGSHMRFGRGEQRTGGDSKPRILANCLEAVLGAVFEDAGFPPAEAVVKRLWAGHFVTVKSVGIDKYGLDPKSLLQQRTQARWGATPRYIITGEDGPAHERRFRAEVVVGAHLKVMGEFAPRKQDAGRSAAREALVALAALDGDQDNSDEE